MLFIERVLENKRGKSKSAGWLLARGSPCPQIHGQGLRGLQGSFPPTSLRGRPKKRRANLRPSEELAGRRPGALHP